MLRHVTVFRWIEGTSPAEVSAVVAGLSALPAQIPSIRSYRFGPDAGLGMSANADFAVVADFDDVEGYSDYASHPAHQDVLVRLVRPLLAERLSVQVSFAADGAPAPTAGTP